MIRIVTTEPSANSQCLGFLLFFLFVLLAAAIIANWRWPRPRQLRTERFPFVTVATSCRLRCGRLATVYRLEQPDLGGRYAAVCPGHSDEGDIKGWWAS